MDFTITPEHEQLRDLIRNFAEKELRPVAARNDKTHTFPYRTDQKIR
jgi:alkylation response protein AidB-like acyl-CoA dehydrogenase